MGKPIEEGLIIGRGSEAQERMVLAVPPENLPALIEICETYWVELSDIGEFIPTGRLEVHHGTIPVVDLENSFLHTCPRRELKAVVRQQQTLVNHQPWAVNDQISEYRLLLTALLSHPNIASKESIIRVYDHEVRGSTVVKPLAGPKADGPSDAAVLKPLNTEGWRGFTLANGINPILSEADAYAMAVKNNEQRVRRTHLPSRLRKACGIHPEEASS